MDLYCLQLYSLQFYLKTIYIVGSKPKDKDTELLREEKGMN